MLTHSLLVLRKAMCVLAAIKAQGVMVRIMASVELLLSRADDFPFVVVKEHTKSI